MYGIAVTNFRMRAAVDADTYLYLRGVGYLEITSKHILLSVIIVVLIFLHKSVILLLCFTEIIAISVTP